MTTIELHLADGSEMMLERTVAMNFPSSVRHQVKSPSDCKALARAILYKLPLEVLFCIEAVTVEVSDETYSVFSVQELVKELTGARYLVYGVHMPAFRRVLFNFITRRLTA